MGAGYRDGVEGLHAHLRELVRHAEQRIASAPREWWAARIDAHELDALRAKATGVDSTADAPAVLAATSAAESWIKRIESSLVIRYAEVVSANALPDRRPSAERLPGVSELGAIGLLNPTNVVERLRVLAHYAGEEWHCYVSGTGDPCAELDAFDTPLLWMVFGSSSMAPQLSADEAMRDGTHMLATTVRASQPPVSLRPAGFFSGVGSMLGLVRDARLDDESFDERFVVDASDEAARDTLGAEARALANELLDRLGNLHLVVANGVARLWWRGPAVDQAVRDSVIMKGAKLLAMIRHAPVPEAMRPPSVR